MNPQSFNKYTYCFNNPLNRNDPTGNWPNWVKSFANTVKSVNWGAVLQTASQVAAIVLTTISVVAAVAAIVDTGNIMAVSNACMEYPAEITTIEQASSEIFPAEISDLGSGLQATVEDNSATTIGREIGSYDEVKTPGFETHHLIEKRFNPQLVENGYDTAESPCSPLLHEDHVPYTNAWQDQIPYKDSSSILRTDNATISDIWNAAQKVYLNDPDYLDAVNRYLHYGQY